jgi:hypothetical protein
VREICGHADHAVAGEIAAEDNVISPEGAPKPGAP